jgi:alpha-1,3-glucosyltransferase
VHRNWLAITSSLPLQDWYFEATSFWTLDYPPFFAWFEYALSFFAPYADPSILVIQAHPYVSAAATYFQRGSVMFTDLLLLGAIWSFVQTMPSLNSKPDADKSSSQWSLESKHWVVICVLIFNAGLFIVDHIHFQYNGMLLGMLIYSVSLIRQGRDLPAGVVFAALLNFKHLFLYLAPAYFIYLWRHYCTHSNEPLLRFDDFDAHQSPTSPVFTACLQRSNIHTPPLYSISNDKAPSLFNLTSTKTGSQGSWCTFFFVLAV